MTDYMTDYANKGKTLELQVNFANEQYLARRVALVQKIPTPWTVIRRGAQIISEFPAQKSTVDYIGVSTLMIRQSKLERVAERIHKQAY